MELKRGVVVAISALLIVTIVFFIWQELRTPWV